MSTKAIETAIKILENLPESTQERLVDKLRRLALEGRDEARWDELFARSGRLKAVAQKARQEIAAGRASDMDFEKL
ncbi:MAG TPA: hypothetical protein VLA99_01430 [Nitrospiraceae bacterium]|nr:hypothetical protein [Nitrospiraceae bacterium]